MPKKKKKIKSTKKKKKKLAPSKIVLPMEKTIIAQKLCDYITCFYGPPGVGKTQFVDSLTDRTFFISTDRGTRFLPALRLEVNTWKEILAVVKALEKEGVKDKYKLIALDHIDDIALMAEDMICASLEIESLGDVGYAKGYRLYKKAIWALVQRIMALDVGVCLIAHETIKEVKTTVLKLDVMMPDLTKSAWKMLIPKCDLVGYCHFGSIRKGGKKREIRVVRTMPTKHVYAKDRTLRRKPEEGWEPLDGEAFVQTFSNPKLSKKKKRKKGVLR